MLFKKKKKKSSSAFHGTKRKKKAFILKAIFESNNTRNISTLSASYLKEGTTLFRSCISPMYRETIQFL